MPFDAARMKRLREKRGLTQRQLAQKLGLAYQEIQRYERADKPTEPRTARLEEIARALDTSVGYLTGHTDDPNHFAEADLTPDELKLIRAYRSGDLKTLNDLMLAKARKDMLK